jgi:hypothetical protein
MAALYCQSGGNRVTCGSSADHGKELQMSRSETRAELLIEMGHMYSQRSCSDIETARALGVHRTTVGGQFKIIQFA